MYDTLKRESLGFRILFHVIQAACDPPLCVLLWEGKQDR
uniref:Uncharacterized protein n=1 Tax=Anguilla anguilla TaxID=7936 RepID=A0A0E9RPL3_ANGAN